jgi:hypothetical protein
MKTLIDIKLLKYGRALAYCGMEVAGLDKNIQSEIDSFDLMKPDLFICKSSTISRSIINCLSESPHIKSVILNNEDDPEKMQLFREHLGEPYLLIDSDSYVDTADVILYNGSKDLPKYQTDIVCTERFDRYPSGLGLKLRIFNSKLIDNKNYCGHIDEVSLKHIYRSAKLSLTKINRLNILYAGGIPVSIEDCDDLTKLNDILNLDRNKFTKDALEEILTSKTNLHTVANILNKTGYEKESKVILNKIGDFK